MTRPRGPVVVREVERPPRDAVAVLGRLPAAALADCVGAHQVMDPGLRPLRAGLRLCGPAVTSEGLERSARRHVIDLARPGDVLVVGAGSVTAFACFGGDTAAQLRAKGLAGLVIDGVTRDRQEIAGIGLPVFVRGLHTRKYYNPRDDRGSVNVPVACAGVRVTPGDVVVADDDGVVVVPAASVEQVAAGVASGRLPPRAPTEDAATSLARRGYRFVDSPVQAT